MSDSNANITASWEVKTSEDGVPDIGAVEGLLATCNRGNNTVEEVDGRIVLTTNCTSWSTRSYVQTTLMSAGLKLDEIQ
jgi:hypothetical protein